MKIDSSKTICGYRLQELIYINKGCFALGWNPDSGMPFATWKMVSTGQSWNFHVFKTLKDARKDLLRRAKSLLSIQELSDLLPASLSPEEKQIFCKLLTHTEEWEE